MVIRLRDITKNKSISSKTGLFSENSHFSFLFFSFLYYLRIMGILNLDTEEYQLGLIVIRNLETIL